MRIENEQIHYRTRFELCPYETTKTAVVPALRAIYLWIYKKEQNRDEGLFAQLRSEQGMRSFIYDSFQYPSGYVGGLNNESRIALSTRTIKRRESGAPKYWAMEYDEPDSQYPFRHWHTRIGISVTNDDTCIINAKVSYYMLPGYIGGAMRDPGANIPGFAKVIIGLGDYQCCMGETVIENDITVLNEDNFEESFKENLLAPGRELPLILVTCDQDGKYPIENLREFSSRLLGMANVYCLDWRNWGLRSQLFDLFKRGTPAFSYRCNACSVRVYQPNIDLNDENSWRSHRFYSSGDIARRYKNVRTFTDMLNRSFGRSFIKTEEDILDLNDIALREGRAAVEENKKRVSELKEKLKELQHMESLREAAPNDSLGEEQVEVLKNQIAELKENATFLKQLIVVMEQSEKELESQIENLELKNLELEEENRDYQTIKFRLDQETRRANDSSEAARSFKHELKAFHAISHWPTSLEEELDLAGDIWKDRIIVLDEARKSAREYRHCDLDESWQMLSSLAIQLWDIFFAGGDASNPEQDYYTETGITLAMRERGTTNSDAECRRLRKRTFQGREIDITPHIKGNGVRYAGNAGKFRIHFCIDEETRKIIIGHCGEHLKTSGTRRL